MSEFDAILDTPEQSFAPTVYGGFWMRFLAALVDGIILAIPMYGLMFIFMDSFIDFSNPEAMGEEPPIAGMMSLVIGLIVLQWLYYALMESGKNQATIGKMALNLKVTNMDGGRISFLQATGRHFGKIISGLIIYIGYIMAGFTEKKQALHDMMASCLVVKKNK